MSSQPDPTLTRVAIYEPRRLVRQGLAIWINKQPEIELVGSAPTVAALTRLCEQEEVDVAILGIPNLEQRVLQDASILAKRFVRLRLIAVTNDKSLSDRVVLAYGFRTVVPSESGSLALLKAVHHKTEIKSSDRSPLQAINKLGPLTQREAQVLTLVGTGITAQDISEKLGISPNTVSNHKERILDKLDANNQAHAVARAVNLGIITPVRDEDLDGQIDV